MDETMSLDEATRKGAEEEFLQKMDVFEKGVHEFADNTRLSIQTMIVEGRSSDGTSMSRPS